MHENVSAIHQSAFSTLCMTKLRNYLLDLKLLLGVQSKINRNILQGIEWGSVTFVYLSPEVWTYNPLQRKGGEICSKVKFIRRVWSAWLWMKSIVLPNGGVQAKTRSFSFSSFSCVVISWLSHFNYARFTSSVWNFWRWTADVCFSVSHVVAGANREF